MIVNNRVFMSAVLALLLVSSTAFAGSGGGQGGGGHHDDGSEYCEPVDAVVTPTGYFKTPNQCDGFDYCIPGTLSGEPTGELTYFGTNATEELDPFGTNLPVNVAAGNIGISTPDGDIDITSHTLYNLENSVYTELYVVTGGTGKYEGATGTMVNSSKLLPTAEVPLDFYAPTSLTGYICTCD